MGTSLTQLLNHHRMVAIVRGTDPHAALRTVLTIAEEDIPLIEVSLTTADALDVIRHAARELGPHTLLGAGTVTTPQDVDAAHRAGAQWIVTPGVTEAVQEANQRQLPVLAGALTPTEILSAQRAGAHAVKLFPAQLGGPSYLTSLRDPFPDVPFVPVGGVDAEVARQYLAAGAHAVGVGSPLVGDAAAGGDLDELRARARQFRTSCTAPQGRAPAG